MYTEVLRVVTCAVITSFIVIFVSDHTLADSRHRNIDSHKSPLSGLIRKVFIPNKFKTFKPEPITERFDDITTEVSTEESLKYPLVLHTLPTNLAKIVVSNNKFGFSLYQSLVNEHIGKNIFMSPLSIYSTLMTIYAGSSNSTRNEMLEMLMLHNMTETDIGKGFSDILNTLIDDAGHGNKLKILNAILVDKYINISSNFTDFVQHSYNAYIEKVKFASEADFVLKWVNDMVSWWTEGNIQNVITYEPDPLTKLMLINVVYFKGKWFETFNSRHTKESIFTNNDKTLSKIPMMRLRSQYFIYCDSVTEICSIELLYSDGALSFLVLIHRNGTDLSVIDKKLSHEFIQYMLSRMETRTLELGLPRFEISGDYHLNIVLESMGMKTAFRQFKADLTRMGGKDLYIKDARHKSRLKVSEEGTIASSSTVAEIGNRIGSQRFFIDRPFIFIIRDLRTEAILFVGRVASLP